MPTRRHVENWINMKKMSTETAGYKFWSKIELVQNSNKIDVISWIKQNHYFFEWNYGIETEDKDQRYLVF